MFRFVKSILVRPVFFSLLSCSLFSPWSWSRDLSAAKKSAYFVHDLKMLSDLTYEKVETLEKNTQLELFYARVENGPAKAAVNFRGFVKLLTRGQTNSVIVAFHGTRAGEFFLHDVYIDFNTLGHLGGYGLAVDDDDKRNEDFGVHREFARQVVMCYDGFNAAIEKIIRDKIGNNGRCDEIVFTGHSMGAALAQLAALLYHEREHINEPNYIKVFAFSSPAIFNSRAKTVYEQKIGRQNSIHICTGPDLVTLPHIYGHAGTMIRINPINRENVLTNLGKLVYHLGEDVVTAGHACCITACGLVKVTKNLVTGHAKESWINLKKLGGGLADDLWSCIEKPSRDIGNLFTAFHAINEFSVLDINEAMGIVRKQTRREQNQTRIIPTEQNDQVHVTTNKDLAAAVLLLAVITAQQLKPEA